VTAALVGVGAEAQEAAPVAPIDAAVSDISESTPAVDPADAGITTEVAPAEGGRSISGTIEGIDGRAVNARIALVLRDAQDRPIHMNGQVHSDRAHYERTVEMNRNAPIDGLPAGGDVNWRIDGFPSNAHHFTLEVYPLEPGPSSGVFTHYGGAVKRNLRLPPGRNLSNIRIVFPLNCTNVPGGTTGSIRVRRYVNGRPAGNLSKFVGTGADFPPFGIQGFRDQRVIPAGDASPEFDGLAPNRRYGVEIFVPGSRYTFFEVPVRECRRTDVIVWSGRPSPVPPRFTRLSIGARAPGFPVPGDFDGDGDDDLYFAAPNGGELWRSDGSGTRFVRTADRSNGSHKVTSGDFNGDGISDLLFYGPGTRPDRIWQFDSTGAHQDVALRVNAGNSSTYPITGDFDRNGRTDVLFVTPGGNSVLRRFTNAGHTDSNLRIPAGFTVRAGDFDGDWQADLFLYRPLRDYGEFEAWQTRANGTSFTRHAYRLQPARFQMIVGDVSGDFKADIVFYQPGSAIDVLWRGRAPSAPFFTRETANLGITGSFIPVTGDWNGDGTEDIFFYGPGAAADRIWRSNQPAWLIQQRHPAP
jgi:hypothetical protein